MAVIRPFRGYRPAPGLDQEITTLPYDVVSEEEARAAVEKNRKSFFRIIRPEVNFPRGIDCHSDPVYDAARSVFNGFIADGLLKRDREDSFYLYTLEMGGRRQTGLVATVSAADYRKGIIKRHELTREDKELDRVKHLDAVNANCGSVYLFYKNEKGESFESLAAGAVPLADFIGPGGVRHVLSQVSDAGVLREIIKDFENRDLYIADGHHRAASAVRISDMRNKSQDAPDNYFLSVIFPGSELAILPYNRAVADLNGMNGASFLAAVGKRFSIGEGSSSPRSRGSIACYLEKKWYTLTPLEPVPADPVEGLDVSVLQDRILSPILGIDNPRTSERIRFIGGIRGVGELEDIVNRNEMAVAFSLYPTGIDQLIEVSDAGGLMPPKSTWFEPKLLSGLVIHPLLD